MKGIIRTGRVPAALLSAALLLATFGGLGVRADAYELHHHSRGRGALVGGTVGLVSGALVGGGKGALIGAEAGAATGYLVQRHRNAWRPNHWRRHHRRHHYGYRRR